MRVYWICRDYFGYVKWVVAWRGGGGGGRMGPRSGGQGVRGIGKPCREAGASCGGRRPCRPARLASRRRVALAPPSEDVIRRNFLLVYELLDEVMRGRLQRAGWVSKGSVLRAALVGKAAVRHCSPHSPPPHTYPHTHLPHPTPDSGLRLPTKLLHRAPQAVCANRAAHCQAPSAAGAPGRAADPRLLPLQPLLLPLPVPPSALPRAPLPLPHFPARRFDRARRAAARRGWRGGPQAPPRSSKACWTRIARGHARRFLWMWWRS